MMIQRYHEGSGLNYYEYAAAPGLQPLVLIHGQGVDARSYENVVRPLSRRFHIYSVDCYGHGGSSHDPARYNIRSLGEGIARWIEAVIGGRVWLLGHSSGGLIAAYVAAQTDWCDRLFLEDPPFFACQGERRRHTFNYVDLSTVCYTYNRQSGQRDFVLYYFTNQYAWNFFPEKSREKVRRRLVKMAASYRRRHPDRDLKVPFWPREVVAGYQGMNNYDPRFGETFYDDSFHCGIPHEAILNKIRCQTVFMKAKTNETPDGILLAALSEEDAARAAALMERCEVVRFDCGHGIHMERRRAFLRCLLAR